MAPAGRDLICEIAEGVETIPMRMPREWIGKWRITHMHEWDQQMVDLMGPGHFRFWEYGRTFGSGQRKVQWTAGWRRAEAACVSGSAGKAQVKAIVCAAAAGCKPPELS